MIRCILTSSLSSLKLVRLHPLQQYAHHATIYFTLPCSILHPALPCPAVSHCTLFRTARCLALHATRHCTLHGTDTLLSGFASLRPTDTSFFTLRDHQAVLERALTSQFATLNQVSPTLTLLFHDIAQCPMLGHHHHCTTCRHRLSTHG